MSDETIYYPDGVPTPRPIFSIPDVEIVADGEWHVGATVPEDTVIFLPREGTLESELAGNVLSFSATEAGEWRCHAIPPFPIVEASFIVRATTP